MALYLPAFDCSGVGEDAPGCSDGEEGEAEEGEESDNGQEEEEDHLCNRGAEILRGATELRLG